MNIRTPIKAPHLLRLLLKVTKVFSANTRTFMCHVKNTSFCYTTWSSDQKGFGRLRPRFRFYWNSSVSGSRESFHYKRASNWLAVWTMHYTLHCKLTIPITRFIANEQQLNMKSVRRSKAISFIGYDWLTSFNKDVTRVSVYGMLLVWWLSDIVKTRLIL